MSSPKNSDLASNRRIRHAYDLYDEADQLKSKREREAEKFTAQKMAKECTFSPKIIKNYRAPPDPRQSKFSDTIMQDNDQVQGNSFLKFDLSRSTSPIKQGNRARCLSGGKNQMSPISPKKVMSNCSSIRFKSPPKS